MDYYLSSADIKDIIGSENVKIMAYDEIFNNSSLYPTIDHLFYDTSDGLVKNQIALLYTHTTGPGDQHIGHWTALIRYRYPDMYPYKNNTILFFDSYGNEPDEMLSKFSLEIRKKYHEDKKYLLKLLYAGSNRYMIEYNDKKIQGKDTATCGRWVCAIMELKWMTLDQFYFMFSPEGNITSDELVTSFIKIDNV